MLFIHLHLTISGSVQAYKCKVHTLCALSSLTAAHIIIPRPCPLHAYSNFLSFTPIAHKHTPIAICVLLIVIFCLWTFWSLVPCACHTHILRIHKILTAATTTSRTTVAQQQWQWTGPNWLSQHPPILQPPSAVQCCTKALTRISSQSLPAIFITRKFAVVMVHGGGSLFQLSDYR